MSFEPMFLVVRLTDEVLLSSVQWIARYLVVAGGFFAVLWWIGKRRFRARRIQSAAPGARGMRGEIAASLVSVLVFACVGAATRVAGLLGYVSVDWRTETPGLLEGVFLVAAMVLIHDAYFYWAHRAMHWRGIAKLVHGTHHLSHNPSPWTSFSFHPWEAAIEAGIYPVVMLTLPMYSETLFAFSLVLTVNAVVIHCGYEVYPRCLLSTRAGAWLMTSTLHNVHHARGHGNYGLYLTLWDRLMGTWVEAEPLPRPRTYGPNAPHRGGELVVS